MWFLPRRFFDLNRNVYGVCPRNNIGKVYSFEYTKLQRWSSSHITDDDVNKSPRWQPRLKGSVASYHCYSKWIANATVVQNETVVSKVPFVNNDLVSHCCNVFQQWPRFLLLQQCVTTVTLVQIIATACSKNDLILIVVTICPNNDLRSHYSSSVLQEWLWFLILQQRIPKDTLVIIIGTVYSNSYHSSHFSTMCSNSCLGSHYYNVFQQWPFTNYCNSVSQQWSWSPYFNNVFQQE
jgi:hypothetical protein